MPEAHSGFAEVNGTRLYYEVAGAGHPLVMLHGHLIDSGQWDDQFEVFAAHYRVIRYDARGFGQSTRPAQPFAYYEDLYGLLTFLGIQRAYLIGCSGGGATIIDFVLAYPNMVDALVLVGSGLGGYSFPSALPPLILELRAAQERGDIDRAVELALQLWTDGPNRTPDQVKAIARERTRAMTARLFARPEVAAPICALDPPAIDRLEDIHVPALVIAGDQDLPPIIEIADILTRRIRGARKGIIADAGHHPNMEHPEEFNQAVLSFLAHA